MAKRKYFPQKRNKYGNHKVILDNGLKFDSEKEYYRYLELKDLEEKGIIWNLELQKPFELIPTQRYTNPWTGETTTYRKCCYYSDFCYITKQDGIERTIVEDVKGIGNNFTTELEVFKIKRKLLIQKYGQEIDFRVV